MISRRGKTERKKNWNGLDGNSVAKSLCWKRRQKERGIRWRKKNNGRISPFFLQIRDFTKQNKKKGSAVVSEIPLPTSNANGKKRSL